MSLLDVCKFNVSTSGTSDFIVTTAVQGYQTPASAGAVNGATYSYRAESSDLSQWEVGQGAYTVSTTTLARTTIIASSNSNSKVSFTSAPQVGIVALKEDLSSTSSSPVLIEGIPPDFGNAGILSAGFLRLKQMLIPAGTTITGVRTYIISSGTNTGVFVPALYTPTGQYTATLTASGPAVTITTTGNLVLPFTSPWTATSTGVMSLGIMVNTADASVCSSAANSWLYQATTGTLPSTYNSPNNSNATSPGWWTAAI